MEEFDQGLRGGGRAGRWSEISDACLSCGGET